MLREQVIEAVAAALETIFVTDKARQYAKACADLIMCRERSATPAKRTKSSSGRIQAVCDAILSRLPGNGAPVSMRDILGDSGLQVDSSSPERMSTVRYALRLLQAASKVKQLGSKRGARYCKVA